MSQFAQSGSAMDEAQSSDGDGGFLSVNQRLQLNQLENLEFLKLSNANSSISTVIASFSSNIDFNPIWDLP